MRPAYLAWFLFHFFLIATVCCRETFLLAARGLTVLPKQHANLSRKAEGAAAAILGLHLSRSNPFRQSLATYLSLAGIDAGYGYFAPNVPNSYELIFELHYPDGRSENELASARRGATGLRVSSLMDYIGRTNSGAFREYLIKKVAAVVWREHPDVVTMRVSLAQREQPTIGNYEQGKRETYSLLYIYDFSLSPD
jgi:hypothetical protein